MPKEITHWCVAKKAFEEMEASELKEALKVYKNVYYLGAISFDIPYFSVGKKSRQIADIANNLHQSVSENKLGELLNYMKKSDEDYVRAFVLGIVTHIITDSAFHPLVFYLTGNYHDNNPDKRSIAVCKHREFEAELDLYYKYTNKLENNYSSLESYNNKGIAKDEFLNLLSLEYENDYGLTKKDICKSMKAYFITQHLFFSNILYRLVSTLNNFFGLKLSQIIACFYPPTKSIDYSFFTNIIDYKDPVTGEAFNQSISDIEKKAVRSIIEIFRQISNAGDKNEVADIVKKVSAVCLDTGSKEYTSKDMKYFK